MTQIILAGLYKVLLSALVKFKRLRILFLYSPTREPLWKLKARSHHLPDELCTCFATASKLHNLYTLFLFSVLQVCFRMACFDKEYQQRMCHTAKWGLLLLQDIQYFLLVWSLYHGNLKKYTFLSPILQL